MMSSGKRKREDFTTQYQNSGYIPQQDGAGDVTPEVAMTEVSLFLIYSDSVSCFCTFNIVVLL